ncbi:protein piccolo [Dermacentor albipictus]|uniref:protein piccolo n=1 Tax=Dermacentor albipictus TaxID=60249 RepID=UPI0031FD0BF6
MTPTRLDDLNMISNNVMSFVKKMVKSGSDEDGMRLGSKFRATVAGLSPRASRADLGHLTPEERSILARVWQKEDEFETLVKKSQTPPLTPPTSQPTSTATSTPDKTCDKVFPGVASVKIGAGVPSAAAGANNPAAPAAATPPPPPPSKPCRICRKGIQAGEPCHTCDDCKQLVCDDCASYSRDPQHAVWRCSCCRRRMSHDRLGPPPGSGMHRVPSVRRMTERIVQDSGGLGCSTGPRGSFMLSEPLKEALRLEMQMQVDGGCLAPPSARTIVKRGSYAGQTEWQRNGLRSSSPERRHSYQKPAAGPDRDASSDSSLEDDYLPRAGRLRRKSRLQRHKSRTAADEEDSEGNEWRSNTSSSSALDSLEADGGPPPPTHPASSHRGSTVSGGRLGVLTRYSSESSDVSDLSGGGRGAPESSPDERRSIPSVTVDAIGLPPPSVGLYEEVRRCSTGSALPRMPIPENQLCLFPGAPHGTGSTHSLDLPREELGKPERRASAPEGDNIKIVIDDVDSQGPPPTPLRKRVLLQRDPADTGARTRGFGMRVMGGKKAPDGHLYAAVAWVLAGSSADLAGLKQGDVILEWNGTSLVDRSYEEVCAILDKSPHSVELVVETGRKMSNRELRASTGNIPSRKSSTCSMGGGEGAATRRKLPKTPDEICNKAHVQGELGVRLWYDGTDLEVTVLGARGLPPRRSYVKLRLHEPGSGLRGPAMKTPISEPVTSPEWNKTFVFSTLESLEGLFLDLTVWDHRPVGTNAFLGEVQLPLDRSPLRDAPEWLPLSRGAGGAGRSQSQELPPDDLIRSSSMDSMLLHPDDAWQGNPVERKSSAPSVYSVSPVAGAKNRQLLAQDSLPELYASSPTQAPERAKSASFKVRRNVNLPDTAAMDERRSLPRRKLSRTVSLKSDERVNHVPHSKGGNDGGDSSSGSDRCLQEVGPGQKNSRRDLARLGELKLGFIMTKGQLEVEVVCARGLPLGSGGTPPDTYVKTYLKEGDRQMQKRKTRVVRHSCEPQYRQTLKYTAADVLGRSLLVTVWERARGFDHNQPLGAALVQLDRLELSRLTLAWYALQTPAGPASASGPRGNGEEEDDDDDDSP